MMDAERDLREMMQRTADSLVYSPRSSPALVRRARLRRAGTTLVAVTTVLGLLFGGFAAIRSVSNDHAAPVRPAEEQLQPREGVEIITASLGMMDPVTGTIRRWGDFSKALGTVGNAVRSASGEWIAYDIHSLKDSLWVVGAQGEPRKLAGDAQGAWTWSPVDERIAMMRSSKLIIFDASTGQETDLGRVKGEGNTLPVWSPDGTRILYPAGASIYSVDVAGGDHVLLAQPKESLYGIDGIEWSPNGVHVAFLATLPDGGDLEHLYVMNADGSGLQILVDSFEPGGWRPTFPADPLTSISWSPDGSRLLYPSFTGPRERELQIWTAPVDGSAPSLVTSHTNDECCIDGGDPVWSPDGSHIAFQTDAVNDGGFLVVDADGTREPSEIDMRTYQSWRGGWYFCYCFG